MKILDSYGADVGLSSTITAFCAGVGLSSPIKAFCAGDVL